MRAALAGPAPVLIAALLALAASLLASLSPLAAGLSVGAIFLLGVPLLAALQERLQALPALIAAATVLLLALHGILGG